MTQTDFTPGTWHLDPSATTLTVTVKKLGLFTIPATLDVNSGTVDIDSDGQIVGVTIEADASSYASKNDKRNEHVVGPDFLDAEQFPTITLRATEVTATAGGGFTCRATIEAKGTSSPIDVTISDVRATEAEGSFTATATVDRNAIGVDKLPSFVIGNELSLTFTTTATHNP